MMATPNDPPSSCTMLRSPDPAPTLSGESVPTMAVDAGATASPMPDPIRPKAMAMVKNPESTVNVATVTNPPAMSTMPVSMMVRRPKRAVRRAATLLLTRLPMANGKKRMPTPNGSAPWTNWMYWLRR